MTTRKVLIIEQCSQCRYPSKYVQACWHPQASGIVHAHRYARVIRNKFSIPTWCPLDDVSYSNPAITILKAIIKDATGDLDDLDKCSWPIRAENYRKAVKVIENENNKT